MKLIWLFLWHISSFIKASIHFNNLSVICLLWLLSSLLHVGLDFHEKFLILLIFSLNVDLLIICCHDRTEISDCTWLYRIFLKNWWVVMVKRLALVFRGRFHKWVIVGRVLTKNSRLLNIWLSWGLMTIETRVCCSIHDEKFGFQGSKLDLFLLWSDWWWGAWFIFSQVTAQCSVYLFEIHCYGTRRSGSWIVALIILHYILVTIIGVRIKYRFDLGIVELPLGLEILTYLLWVLNTVFIKWDFQVSFDRVFILVFIWDIVIIDIWCWVIIAMVVLLSRPIHIVWGQLIVSITDDYGLEISWL